MAKAPVTIVPISGKSDPLAASHATFLLAFMQAVVDAFGTGPAGQPGAVVEEEIIPVMFHTASGADWTWTVDADYYCHGGLAGVITIFSSNATDDYAKWVGGTNAAQVVRGVLLYLTAGMILTGVRFPLARGQVITISANTVGNAMLFLSHR